MIPSGSIVVVDVSRTDPAKLHGRMVAVRASSGIVIKRLQRDGETYFLLDGQLSLTSSVILLRDDCGYSILGEVASWVGTPSRPAVADSNTRK